MPKVLHILNRINIGGPALNTSLLTKYLPDDYETTLVVGPPEAHEKNAGFLLEQLGIEPIVIPEMGRAITLLDDWKAYRNIKALIKNIKPDIVHTHASKAGAIGRWAAAACKVPVIVHTFHGHVFHSYFSPLKTKIYIEIEKNLAQKTDKLIAISTSQKNDLTEVYKIAPQEKVAVISLGFNLEPFNENKERKRVQFRSQYNLEVDDLAIGIIGRLAPIKNHPLFLDAIKTLHTQANKKIKAFIVGDGECRSKLEQYCIQLGLGYSTPEHEDFSQPVIFTSWRTDIDVVNAGLDIITLTSFNEGTPVSIIEAQAAGKPIVATHCGGIADVVIENETALLSPVQLPEKFISNLQLVVDNANLRRLLSERCSQFAVSKFHFQRQVEETDALYKKLLAQAGR